MKRYTDGNFNIQEGEVGDILVICDAIDGKSFEATLPMAKRSMEVVFEKEAARCGLDIERFTLLTSCPPIPAEEGGSDALVGKWLANYRPEFLEVLEDHLPKARIVLAMGKVGARQLAGRPVAITKARGTLTTCPASGDLPVLPLLGPWHVHRRPELRETYDTDFRQVVSLQDSGWDMEEFGRGNHAEGYRWCMDIQFLLDNPPAALATDCETVGLDWHLDGFRILSVSLTPRKGVSYVVPLDVAYATNQERWGDSTPEEMKTMTEEDRERLIGQLRELFSGPTAVSGHNLKFDIHSLRTVGVPILNWYADTMQLAFVCDDNMQSKSLDDCTRRWLAHLAGYADEFNKNTDKSRMDLVGHDEMLEYAGADTDATYQLTNVLLKIAKEDMRNWETFFKIQMPALRSFVEMEKHGVRVDKDALRDLRVEMEERERELYSEMMEMVPAKVLRAHEGRWSFSRTDFVVDILFGKHGIKDPDTGRRLRPLKFTKATQNLSDPKKRIPSTSAKEHLPYFEHIHFVRLLMQYKKLTKMISTYVGKEGTTSTERMTRTKAGAVPVRIQRVLDENGITHVPKKSKAVRERKRRVEESVTVEASNGNSIEVDRCGNVFVTTRTEDSGFWQYLRGTDLLHTSWLLHVTNTGRAASRDPNLQNIPKRGELAKSFRKIFLPPTPGWKWLALDYSQVELRIAAWMAREPRMIQIYKMGGDIHASTAAAIMGVDDAKFIAGMHDPALLVERAGEWPGAAQWLRLLPSTEAQVSTVADYCGIQRYRAKAVNFGFLYSMWWKTFRVYAKTDYGIDYTEEEAEAIYKRFFRTYRGLQDWHGDMRGKARKFSEVRALHGAVRRLPNVNSFDEGIQGLAERQAINAPVQRFASDLGLIALNRVIRDAPEEAIHPVLFVHDDISSEVHPDYVGEMASALKFYMENPPLEEWFDIKPPFPLVADVSTGDNLGQVEELEDVEAIEPEWYQSGLDLPPVEDHAARLGFVDRKRRGIILSE